MAASSTAMAANRVSSSVLKFCRASDWEIISSTVRRCPTGMAASTARISRSTVARKAGRAHRPRQRNNAAGKFREAIGHLGLRHVHDALSVVGEPGFGDVADDADDLPRPFLKLRTETPADHHDLAQDLLLG